MATASLLVAGVVSIGTGISFASVARAVARKEAAGPRRSARGAHATWWAALAAYLVIQGVLTVSAGLDRLSTEAYLASRVVAIPLLCASVWGLTSYLLFLYTGDGRAMTALAFLYAGVAALFYVATFGQQLEVQVHPWLVTIDDSGTLYRIVYLLVGVPPIAAALAYLGLLTKVRDQAQRYRIALVAGSILAYIGSGLAARLAAGDIAIFVSLVVLGAGAAIASLLAYYPPDPVRARLGMPPSRRSQRAKEREAELQWRVSELI